MDSSTTTSSHIRTYTATISRFAIVDPPLLTKDYIPLPLHRPSYVVERPKRRAITPPRPPKPRPPPREPSPPPRVIRQVVIDTIHCDEFGEDEPENTGRPPHRTFGLSPSDYQCMHSGKVHDGSSYLGLPPAKLVAERLSTSPRPSPTKSIGNVWSNVDTQAQQPQFTKRYGNNNRGNERPDWAELSPSQVAGGMTAGPKQTPQFMNKTRTTLHV